MGYLKSLLALFLLVSSIEGQYYNTPSGCPPTYLVPNSVNCYGKFSCRNGGLCCLDFYGMRSCYVPPPPPQYCGSGICRSFEQCCTNPINNYEVCIPQYQDCPRTTYG